MPDQGSHDAVYHRAVEAGAKPVMPPNDTFWGDRFGGLQDPFGHNWAIATRKENLTDEEVRRRADALVASMSGAQPAS